MQDILFYNIGTIVQTAAPSAPLRGAQLDQLATLANGYVWVRAGIIHEVGSMAHCPTLPDAHSVDAKGGLLLPCWCDSHTHLVFAKSREQEFEDRLRGMTYQQIAERGGGILHSAKALQATDADVLFEQAQRRLANVIATGTGAIEIKSGYGLTTAAELKMLRVIKRLKASAPISIKATFLGAHTIPMEYRANRQYYIDMLIKEMLPTIAEEKLADYIDVFCEKVAFSAEETDQILAAGAAAGLRAKIHTNQFTSMGGIATAIAHNALSVDHLEVINEAEITELAHSQVIATLLPSAPFFLKDHYPPARQLLAANIAVALASDYNPGTSPSGKLPLVLTLACTQLKMTPAEAINALTINGAFAMDVAATQGSISVGKAANFILTHPVPSIAYLPYAFGEDWIAQVYLGGHPYRH